MCTHLYSIVIHDLILSLPGGIGVIWFVLWLYLGYDSPATHPRISDKERKYIESSIKEEGATRNAKEKVNSK